MIKDQTKDGRRPVAYLNESFLESSDARPLRIISEYLEPLSHFRDQKIQVTVVFFGSARLHGDGPLGHYYEAARELAPLVTEWSENPKHPAHRFLVLSPRSPSL